MVRCFIRLFRTTYNLKFINCLFLEFFVQYFQSVVDHRKPTTESKTVDKRGVLYGESLVSHAKVRIHNWQNQN